VPTERTRGGGNKQKYRKSHLKINFFTVNVVKQRKSLHREIVQSPFLELLKTQLGTAPSPS